MAISRTNRTRRRLQEEAVRLFASRGYHNVTVEEVARSAGVSHMTFFRHFPTKASVLVDDPYDPIIGETVAGTDPSLPPLERVRIGLTRSWSSLDEPDDELIRARFRILTENEDIVAHAWSNNQRTEQVIIDALVASGVTKLEARVAAGAVIGALTAALLDWAESDDSGRLGDRVRETLELLAPSGEGDGT
ncbi:MAG: TetR/AcrR family transcriptional regulator [Acidimicrobiia bacterium]